MGPLAGIQLIELAGIGPGPMAAMMLGDMGADIVRVDRIEPTALDRLVHPKHDAHRRSRRSLGLDLQNPRAAEVILRLVERADGLIDPFRPGVTERLNVGPDVCLERNPRLVYGRITGWGQEGPLAKSAGHDINYIALTGVLHATGRRDENPVPPLNLIGDYGGGGMLLAFGMLCGLINAMKSGCGQIIDAAMVDGTALLFASIFGMHAGGFWQDERGANMLDSGAHFYDVYETQDKKYVSIGAIEPRFYSLLLQKLGLTSTDIPNQMDRASWPEMRKRFAAVFKRRTREEWCSLLEGTDICFAPVLSIAEAPHHPHSVARGAYIDVDGHIQPAPAPRFSRSKPDRPRKAPQLGGNTEELLTEAGFTSREIEELKAAHVII